MPTTLRPLVVALVIVGLGSSFVHADSSDFSTIVGTVDKFEKETLIVSTGEKSKKTVELKVTGTSKFHLLAPQVRSGKTVATQRTAETSDLIPG